MKKNMTYKEAVFVIFRMWHLVHKYRLRFYIGFLIGSTSIFFFRFLDEDLLSFLGLRKIVLVVILLSRISLKNGRFLL